jgi:hypothetical protein
VLRDASNNVTEPNNKALNSNKPKVSGRLKGSKKNLAKKQ